jgi:6-phosphogluconolactonase (cycloisomerase 2 family)
MHSITAANPTPFGFAVGRNQLIYVSEAAGGAPGASSVSAYSVSSNGELSLVKGPVKAGQTAACWVVITDNEKFLYSTNTGSNNISSFQTDNKNYLSVLKAVAATSGNAPIDAALSNNSKFLYVLNSGNETISAYEVSHTGDLKSIQTVNGLPDGATGMAAN